MGIKRVTFYNTKTKGVMNRNEYRAKLVKRLHVVKSRLGMKDDVYRVLLGGYGVESSKGLTVEQLIELIGRIEPELVKWRTWAVGAIVRYNRMLGRDITVDYARAIACRAAGCETFERITVSGLRAVYNGMKRACEIGERCGSVCVDVSGIGLN